MKIFNNANKPFLQNDSFTVRHGFVIRFVWFVLCALSRDLDCYIVAAIWDLGLKTEISQQHPAF